MRLVSLDLCGLVHVKPSPSDVNLATNRKNPTLEAIASRMDAWAGGVTVSGINCRYGVFVGNRVFLFPFSFKI